MTIEIKQQVIMEKMAYPREQDEQEEEEEASYYRCRRTRLVPYPSTNPVPRSHALCLILDPAQSRKKELSRSRGIRIMHSKCG